MRDREVAGDRRVDEEDVGAAIGGDGVDEGERGLLLLELAAAVPGGDDPAGSRGARGGGGAARLVRPNVSFDAIFRNETL